MNAPPEPVAGELRVMPIRGLKPTATIKCRFATDGFSTANSCLIEWTIIDLLRR